MNKFKETVEAIRLAANETRSMSVTKCMLARASEPTLNARISLVMQDANNAKLFAFIPDANLADFAISSVQALHLRRRPNPPPGTTVRHEERSRTIPIDGAGVANPALSDAPVGHSVLVLKVGDAQISFSAPAETWRQTLRDLDAAASVSPTKQ